MENLSAWLKSRSRPVRSTLLLTVALGELSGILLIIQTALLVRIGNGVIFEHETLAALAPYFWYLPAAIVLRAFAGWASRRAGFACSGAVKQRLRRELFGSIAAAGPVALAGEHAGEIANTVVDAVEALDGYYARYLPQRAIASLIPLTVLAVVFPLDWISGVTLLVTALFIPVLMVLIGEDAHARNQRLWSKLSQMSGRFLDTLQGIPTLKIFGAVKREARIVAEISEEYRRSTMSVMRIAFVSALMLELISTVSIAIVAIASGLRMLAGHMPFAPGYFILLIAPEYFLTLRNLGTFYHSRMEAVSAAEHILRVLAITPMPDEFAPPRRASAERQEGVSGPITISFRNVEFGYGSDRGTVLDGIDLKVGAGERVALVGRSGAGKSTLMALVLGFISPVRGEVLAGDREIAQLERDEWLRRIAWLPQRPTIFHGTIAENIALGRPGTPQNRIEDAARLASADEFIERLPRGYDTFVGERGRDLSGGQIQRIALARLFLRDAALVLLDEPTAHLDSQSETVVRRSISRLAEGRTLLFATHRIASVASADRIVVLEWGRVAEAGTHAELLRRGGRYAALAAGASEEDLE